MWSRNALHVIISATSEFLSCRYSIHFKTTRWFTKLPSDLPSILNYDTFFSNKLYFCEEKILKLINVKFEHFFYFDTELFVKGS